MASRQALVSGVVSPINPDLTHFPMEAVQNPGGATPRLGKIMRHLSGSKGVRQCLPCMPPSPTHTHTNFMPVSRLTF